MDMIATALTRNANGVYVFVLMDANMNASNPGTVDTTAGSAAVLVSGSLTAGMLAWWDDMQESEGEGANFPDTMTFNWIA